MPRAGSHDVERQLELTPRQHEVIALMAAGRTNFDIAQELGLSLEGAKYHVSEILAKLGVTTREEAVAAWRAHQRPGARLKRSLEGLGAALSGVPTAAKVTFAAAFFVGVAGIGLWLAVGSNDGQILEPTPFSGSPDSPEALLDAMTAQLGGGNVLHVRTETTVHSDGKDQRAWTQEGWFALDREAARVTVERDPAYEVDLAEHQEVLYAGGFVYPRGSDDEQPGRLSFDEYGGHCLEGVEPVLQVLICGIGETSLVDLAGGQASLGEGDFEGTPAWVLSVEIPVPPQPLDPQRPERTPGPGEPDPEAGYVMTWRFYAHRGTLLPVATTLRTDADPSGRYVGVTRRFVLAELVSDISASRFDPHDFGYRTDAEKEMAALDNPPNGTPVYWLGRVLAAGDGTPALVLDRVEARYHPERPSAVSLDYNVGTNDWINVESWQKDGWERFHPLVDRAYGWLDRCGTVREFDVPGGRVRLLGGHPQVNGRVDGGVVLQPGQPLPTPTPTPTALALCPPGEPTRWMAEVTFGDTVVTLNAPIGLPHLDQPGDRFGAPAALEHAARALRERKPGE